MPRTGVTVIGARETELALNGVAVDLSQAAGGPIAEASIATAEELAGLLRAAAAASGVPVAPRVARSVTVKQGRRPTVSIGGAQRVGAGGAPAFKLAWGSEHGPAEGADVNHFAVPRSSGYWIKPAVDRLKPAARGTFDLAVAGSIRRHGL